MGKVIIGVFLIIVLLAVVTTLAYLLYITLIECTTSNRFDRRHDIELIETEHTNFAACIKCGRRWEIDEVDEMLFVKRRKWNE